MLINSLTILTTNFNKIDYVTSFLAQAKAALEIGAQIVVVDDGSTDGSFESLKSALGSFKKARIIRTSNNGSASARNLALSLVQTDYFMYLDIDDTINLAVVTETLKEVIATKSDIGIANYKTFPVSSIGRMPISVLKPTKVLMRDIRNAFFESVGYWRSIYRTEAIAKSNIRFLPSFSELGGEFFILDDLYWLVQISALNLEVLIMPVSKIIYGYFRPEDSIENWNKYLNQLALMSKANEILVKETSKNSEIDFDWLLVTSHEFLYQHLRFLDFSFGVRIIRDFRRILRRNPVSVNLGSKIHIEYKALRLSLTFLITSSGLRRIFNKFKALMIEKAT